MSYFEGTYFERIKNSRIRFKKIFERIPTEEKSGVGLLSFYIPTSVTVRRNLCGCIVSPKEIPNFEKFVIYEILHKPDYVQRYIGVNVYSPNPEEILRYAVSRKETDTKIIRTTDGKLTTTTEDVLTNLKGLGEIPIFFGQMTLTLDEMTRVLNDELLKTLKDTFQKITDVKK